MSDFGEQIRKSIRERGLSERELSEATGVEHIAIVYFLRGKDLGIKHASKLATFLGFELRQIAGD